MNPLYHTVEVAWKISMIMKTYICTFTLKTTRKLDTTIYQGGKWIPIAILTSHQQKTECKHFTVLYQHNFNYKIIFARRARKLCIFISYMTKYENNMYLTNRSILKECGIENTIY